MKAKLYRTLQALTGPALGLAATVCVSLGVVLGEVGSPWAGLLLGLIGIGFGGLAGCLIGEESARRRQYRKLVAATTPTPADTEDQWIDEWLES